MGCTPHEGVIQIFETWSINRITVQNVQELLILAALASSVASILKCDSFNSSPTVVSNFLKEDTAIFFVKKSRPVFYPKPPLESRRNRPFLREIQSFSLKNDIISTNNSSIVNLKQPFEERRHSLQLYKRKVRLLE